MKKRILLLLSVVALMVVMLAMIVVPAFGRINQFGCIQKTGFGLVIVSDNPALFSQYDRNGDGIVCRYENPHGTTHFRDNHTIN